MEMSYTILNDHGQPRNDYHESTKGDHTVNLVLRVIGECTIVHWSAEEKGSGDQQGAGDMRHPGEWDSDQTECAEEMKTICCLEDPPQLHSIFRGIRAMGTHSSQDRCCCSGQSSQTDVVSISAQHLEGLYNLPDHGRLGGGCVLGGYALNRGRIEEKNVKER